MPNAGVHTDQDPMGLLGATLRERFRLEAVVASGGFGLVYRAADLALRKPAAVKVLHNAAGSRDAATLLAELREEARRQAAIDHPAVVRVLDLGEVDAPSGAALPWMALEWVEGRTLVSDVRERGAGLALAEAFALLRPVFEALAMAHDNGIVHRDVKPANIMLVAPDAPGRRRGARPAARLLDFGIAKVMAPDEQRAPGGDTETRPGDTAFTVRWAAPEQIGGKRTGPWTDVHALALVLVYMVTGREPFTGDDVLAVIPQVLGAERPTPAHFGVDAGAAEPVIARALALRHPDRYADAGAFLGALDAALAAPAPRPIAPPTSDSAPSIELHDDPSAPSRGVVAPREDTAPPGPRRAFAATALAVVALLVLWRAWPSAPAAAPRAAVSTDARPAVPEPAAPDASPEASVVPPPPAAALAPDASPALEFAPTDPDAGPPPVARPRRPDGRAGRTSASAPRADASAAPDPPSSPPAPRLRFDPGLLISTDGGPPR